MNDTEILKKTFQNMKQIDSFFEGPEYKLLMEISFGTKPFSEKQVASTILNQVSLIDDSIDFFTTKKEWERCYLESFKLVSLLKELIDDKYNPVQETDVC